MFTKILVPLDGSEIAEGILPYVVTLAKGLKAPVVLLAVVEPDFIQETPAYFGTGYQSSSAGTKYDVPVPAVGQSAPPVTGQFKPRLESLAVDDAEERLKKVAGKIAGDGIKVEVVVTVGQPAVRIVDHAVSLGCDLIAMSTHGRNMIGRGILGSVTDKVIHSSSIPSLTITPEKAEKYRASSQSISRIMVPVDGSDRSAASVPYVESIARALGVNLLFVRVVKPDTFYEAYGYGYPWGVDQELLSDTAKAATEQLEALAVETRSRGVAAEWVVLRGYPAVAIVDYARQNPQDLIAMTTHGRTGLTRWIIGSVTEAVIRGSGDPVLVIPPKK